MSEYLDIVVESTLQQLLELVAWQEMTGKLPSRHQSLTEAVRDDFESFMEDLYNEQRIYYWSLVCNDDSAFAIVEIRESYHSSPVLYIADLSEYRLYRGSLVGGERLGARILLLGSGRF